MYMTQGLHRTLQQHPDRVALRFGDRQRSFREFGERVARLAGTLQALGMQTGDRVAMLSLNSDRYLEYQMAVPWGGGVPNPCNIRWSAAEILYSLNDSGSTLLLVDHNFCHLVEQFRRDATSLREVVYCGDGAAPAGMHDYEALLASAPAVPDALRRCEDLAGIFYTGGTTGFPKGVMLSHNNLCSSGMALRSEGLAAPNGIYLHCAPMFHLADMGLSMPHWIEGNTHAIVAAFNPELVLDTLERDRVSHLLLVPTMIQMLVDHPAMKKPRDLGALRTIAYGASTIPEAEVENALAQHPAVLACAVIAIPSDAWGESVHAVVVRRPRQEVAAELLMAHCKSLIAGYKCPRSVDFVDALPLSGAGKVLKTQLREPFWRGRERGVA